MCKYKLLRQSILAITLACTLYGCNGKKEDTQSKNANSTDTVVTTDSNLSTIDANELDSIAESVVADDYYATPSAVKMELANQGYDDQTINSYIKESSIDWKECLTRKINYEIKSANRSEYDLRWRLEDVGFDKSLIDSVLAEMNIDFSEICYDYMYKQCNGRYPDSDEETKLRKDCADNGFTDSQIDAAITKLAENCK